MAIIFHKQSKCFHLYNNEVSYIMRIMENGQLENLYHGKKIHDKEDFAYFHDEAMRSQMSVCIPEPGLLSMQYTRQEYPSYGTGDYRSPAVTIAQENGSRIIDFKYAGHEIYSGKKEILPLPATYVEGKEEAETLEVTLHDNVMDTDLILSYTIYEAYPVITRNTKFVHKGKEKIVLERAMSASVEFLDMDYEMVQLSGGWSRERYVKNRKLEMGIQSIQSLNGTCCGAEHNPFFALKRPHTTESQGEVYGFSLVYSGNYLGQVEVSTFDMTRVMMGINPEDFSWELKSGESFQTPEVVMVYSDKGLNKMSQTYHRLYRKRLMHGEWRDKARPILLNNWEATYFDFNEEKILTIAKKAKEAGVELFVLDDGWFGARNDDYRGLGDWYVNLEKLPDGISGLSKKVEELGLKFGLWVELEMVNKDSDLYRAHPDWIISAPNRFESHARHQNVLDFSRNEVVDYIYEMIAKVIRESSISYIKWDMNRYMSEPYSKGSAPCEQGKVMHKYILGVYDLYTRLTTEFPHILFESCASGGARFDPAMLYFAPQTWCSDDTDASERTKIQYGTSYVYPIVSMGSHVSAVPNHQMHRITPIETRANVAYFGTFGYELDLNLLSDAEIETVKKQIAFMKEHRELIQMDGDFYRLLSPFEGNETAWMVVSSDKTQAVAAFYQRLNKVNASWLRLKLDGLDANTKYEVSCDMAPVTSYDAKIAEAYGHKTDEDSVKTYQAYGDELMSAGIPIDREELNKKGGDFASLLYTLKKVDE
ncbi:alpha-galactosidase [Blautia stercoris]|uniref:Alpha-galactosidase n=1 Tax=Blautia stercoris TaxID=871664 RepID=A0ABR7PEN6_9FIRM|nr:alpha-galactosidase [Blautia stercoris]MBC8629900.1 alpha-galactosidase [Blautia stercoris]